MRSIQNKSVLRGGSDSTASRSVTTCRTRPRGSLQLLDYWQDNQFVQAAIHGAVAAAVGITTKTVWTIAKPYFKGSGRLRVILIGAAAFLLYVVAHIPPIEVLIGAGVVGAFLPVRS